MIGLTTREIGEKLAQAGRLKALPLCIYSSDAYPEDSTPMKNINRCLAHAIFTMSTDKNIKSIYIGNDVLKDSCPGGQAWFGFKEFMPMLKYFLSTGSKDFRNGASEFLLADPDLAEKRLKSIGKISPIGKYIVIRKCDDMMEKNRENFKVNAFLCFGNSEQLRNLCSLAYFRSGETFKIEMPWGPSCASFVTYPSGMTESGPKDSIILGPTDPTGNYWFPQNFLSIGIPIKIAKRMANDLELSFISKRPKVAYPDKRESHDLPD
jgi:hypothetical protein